MDFPKALFPTLTQKKLKLKLTNIHRISKSARLNRREKTKP